MLLPCPWYTVSLVLTRAAPRLSAYNNANAALLFAPLVVLSGDLETVLSSGVLLRPAFLARLALSGVFGFLIGIASYLQISFTSPLTHNISGTAKACLQTLLAVLVWRNPITATNALGILLVAFGSLMYAVVRLREMKRGARRGGAGRRRAEQAS